MSAIVESSRPSKHVSTRDVDRLVVRNRILMSDKRGGGIENEKMTTTGSMHERGSRQMDQEITSVPQ